MEFPRDPSSLSNSTIPAPSLSLLTRETVAWFTYSLGWPRGRMFCFPQNTMWCTSDFSFSTFSLCFTSLAISNCRVRINHNWPDHNSYWWYFVTLSWSLFPVLSPQCRGFLLDGQMQSSKLSLIADRHDKSQVVRSIAAVRQRKDATKLAIFFRFFHAFPGTFQWQTACKSKLRVFSWGLHSSKKQKSGKRRWEAMISPRSL